MRVLKRNTLYCFSPPVMIATFLIEIMGACWTIWRYKLDKVSRLAVSLLVFLALFQLAEFNICEGAFGLSSLWWARIGFVAITFLIPFGIHLARNMAGIKSRIADITTGLGYLAAFCFSAYFLTVPAFTKGECMGNYVIFVLHSNVSLMYAVYYWGLLVLGIGICLYLAAKITQKSTRKALHGLAMGYIAFMVPTIAANIVAPATIAAIPSVMCGFAVIFALVLVGIVLPSYYKKDLTHGNTQTKK